jgi:hypothetical protein
MRRHINADTLEGEDVIEIVIVLPLLLKMRG